MKTKSKKPRLIDATDALYLAAGAYVDQNGGCAVMATCVEVQQWPGDKPNEFRLAVKLLGRKPVLDEPLSRSVKDYRGIFNK